MESEPDLHESCVIEGSTLSFTDAVLPSPIGSRLSLIETSRIAQSDFAIADVLEQGNQFAAVESIFSALTVYH